MAQINLASEVLKHPDDEVIAFLMEKMNAVVRVYSQHEDVHELYACTDAIGLVYNILKAMNDRNNAKSGKNTKVVL